MPPLLSTLVLIGATLAMGLTAGLFYGFACAVMPGLRTADDHTFVRAVQRINVAILNGWFALGFAGAPLLIASAAALHLPGAAPEVSGWILAALVLDLTVIVITMRVNVPMNDELAKVACSAGAAELAAARRRFEARWVRWNGIRAVVSTAAAACLVIALFRYGGVAVIA
ncbi:MULTISPECIES: DUF1772 domain-containing protein [Actinoalloteichus]|uniref:Integral membrane protein n=1 Tax=Actinoalloteichus fjordicus TaxID=1612552 RepID=A0AAC9L885_9PSEU|nr:MULTISPECIES: anthrone oxygenase family protein [Actinoalloteichus]APU12641.1 putative integral membrane protein [Actinoalloteichus fjordicus]APU18594.1 putative integral membrane protein [Actinoalloteichus sp. GBA129-24]